MANTQDPRDLHDAFARLTNRQYAEAQRLGNGTVGIGIGRALDESSNHHDGRAAAEKASMSWEPVETAPLNGKDVLVYTETGLVRIAFFDAARGGVWSSWPGRNEYKPTHWMPLPLPPEQQTRDAQKGK